MSTSRPFAYNTGSPISGTTQVGQLAVGTPTSGFASTGLQWWNGPDEELGYVIAKTFSNQPTPIFTTEPLTLSTTYKPVDILLSNGNKTAYVTNWAYTQTVLSDTLIDKKDKVMFSVNFTSTNPGIMFGAYIGAGTRSMNYSGPFGGFPGTDNQSVGFTQDGNYYYNGAVQATGLPTWTSGSNIDIAIDLSSGNKIWIRVGGGNWNNNPSDNPETGVCSLGMGGLNKIYPALCPGSAAGSSYGTMTLLLSPPYGTPTGFQFLGNNLYAGVKFLRSSNLTDQSFIDLVNSKFSQNFLTATASKAWLTTNGYWTSYGLIPSGMVLYLDASNATSYSGNGNIWYDLSGNGNDVTMQNSGNITWNNTGPVYFSTGTNGWFSNPSATNLPVGNSEYTFIIWVQLGSSWGGNGFMSVGPFGSSNQANAFRAGSTNQLINYWWGNDLVVQDNSVSPTNWFNAVVKYDGITRSIWVNGVLVGSDTPVGHNVTSSVIQIAKTAGNEFLNGNIAEVLIYNTSLSNSDIVQYYNSTKSRFGY